MPGVIAYLAGPDVFLPNAAEHARAKIAICHRHGIDGRAPLNEDADGLRALSDEQAWQLIYAKDIALMEACDVVIANLTPFRGASADSGTLIEVGWFLGRGRAVYGYSNTATGFAERSRKQVMAAADPLPGLAVEGFGLPDNLMIQDAATQGGGRSVMLPPDGVDRPFDALDIFEACVTAIRPGAFHRS